MVYTRASVDLCCAPASTRVRARLAAAVARRELRTASTHGRGGARMRRELCPELGPSDGQPLQSGGQPPNSAEFVCGAMAAFRRAGRVNRVANGSSGAASQREHNEMAPRSLPTTMHERALGRSPEASGPMARATTPLVNSVRVRAAPALQQTGKRIRRPARARTHQRIRASRGRRGPPAARRVGCLP